LPVGAIFSQSRLAMAADLETICFTVDVEWAHPAVLNEMIALFDGYGVRATFFCTHAGVDVGAHERGLHPNYRRNGTTLKELAAGIGAARAAFMDESDLYRHVLSTTLQFAPEAKGARSHSLFYDSLLIPLYREFGLEYDSSCQLPLSPGLRPIWKEYDVLELPIYFSDHFELKSGATGFDVALMHLDRPGLKIINLHPNMFYVNATSDEHYISTKSFYHDPDRLLHARQSRRGIRPMVIDLLEYIASRNCPTATLGEINAAWRSRPRWTCGN
jgi:peptidoglycan/xylan/chitin deacetylase (PgdA/CDA1 family)